jgi:hypothetical protein
MKKVKIMLTALAVVAVVGGALAFKAKTFGQTFCIGDPYVDGIAVSACPNAVLSTTVGAEDAFYATPTDNPQGCEEIQCPSTVLIHE